MKTKASSQNSYLWVLCGLRVKQALLQHTNGEQHLRWREQRKAPRAHSMVYYGNDEVQDRAQDREVAREKAESTDENYVAKEYEP